MGIGDTPMAIAAAPMGVSDAQIAIAEPPMRFGEARNPSHEAAAAELDPAIFKDPLDPDVT
jgi:hypothetical protein